MLLEGDLFISHLQIPARIKITKKEITIGSKDLKLDFWFRGLNMKELKVDGTIKKGKDINLKASMAV